MPEILLLRRTRRTTSGRNDAAPETRWHARPLVALALRLIMAGVPAAAAVLVVLFLERISSAPTTWPARIVTWALLLGVSAIVALIVERRMRSLLPLTLLMRMTLVFPDEAPSRYAVARAANSPAKIRELAAAGGSPQAQAAAQVLALVARLAKHDRHTRGHSERVRVFTDLIAEQMGVPGHDRDKLAWGALLHDIGKLNVPATLLNKPGKPTAQEWDVLERHPLAGRDFAGALAEWLGPWVGGITEHHERYDGHGYPLGVAGQDITLAGRIVAVADAYETMTAARSYKKPMAVAAARQELTACAGAHFDPVVVRAFLAVSLPRLMWGVGPLSFLAHLPFVARAEVVSVQLAAASSAAAPAAAAAAVGAASVVTVGAVAPASPPASPQPAQVMVADNTSGHSGAVVPSAPPTGPDAGRPAHRSPTALPSAAVTSQPVRTSNGLVAGSATATPTDRGATGAIPKSENGAAHGGGNGNSGNGGSASTNNAGNGGNGNSGNGGSASTNSTSGPGNSGNSGNSGPGSSGNSGHGNTGTGNSGNSGNSGPGNSGNSGHGNTGTGNSGNSGNSGPGNSGPGNSGNSGNSGPGSSGNSGNDKSGMSGKGSSGTGNPGGSNAPGAAAGSDRSNAGNGGSTHPSSGNTNSGKANAG